MICCSGLPKSPNAFIRLSTASRPNRSTRSFSPRSWSSCTSIGHLPSRLVCKQEWIARCEQPDETHHMWHVDDHGDDRAHDTLIVARNNEKPRQRALPRPDCEQVLLAAFDGVETGIFPVATSCIGPSQGRSARAESLFSCLCF